MRKTALPRPGEKKLYAGKLRTAAEILAHRAKSKAAQESSRRRAEAREDARRRPNIQRTSRAERIERDCANAGLTIATRQNIQRPTFKVQMPDGRTVIETLQPDLV